MTSQRAMRKIPYPPIPTCCAMPVASPSPIKGADTRLIQDYLGHSNIQHAIRYTVANPACLSQLVSGIS
jgi:hypothetical protein